MNIILVTSPRSNAGKTAFCVALGQWIRRRGQRVGYRRLAGVGASEDAGFIRSVLRLSESIPALTPDPTEITPALSAGFEVLLIEADAATDPALCIRALAGQVTVIPLIVARYVADGLAEMVIAHAAALGLSGARVLVNVVPDKGRRKVQQDVIPQLQAAGLSVIGIVPQDKILLGTTAGDLARALEAEVLCADDGLDLPVEAVMIAAMSDEGAEPYFRRHTRKAVVAAGDRPDIHLPALATDTSCIILTDGRDPDPTVLKTADQNGVPLLKVAEDTLTILERISDTMSRVRCHHKHKVSRALAHFSAHANLGALLADLGLASEAIR